jgi:hypothetical protein
MERNNTGKKNWEKRTDYYHINKKMYETKKDENFISPDSSFKCEQ